MPMQEYGTVASRTTVDAVQKFIKRAENIQVLSSFGDSREHPFKQNGYPRIP